MDSIMHVFEGLALLRRGLFNEAELAEGIVLHDGRVLLLAPFLYRSYTATVLLLQVIETDTDVERLVCLDHALLPVDIAVAGLGDHGKDHDFLIDFLA